MPAAYQHILARDSECLLLQKSACKEKTDHLEAVVEGIFASVELLQTLQEVDSKVDLLKLLTLTIEVVGDKAEPFLHRIASTLPLVRPHIPPLTISEPHPSYSIISIT